MRPLVADLATDEGVAAVADICATEALTLLVNNAGVAHYMPFAELPAAKAAELLHVKVVAPVMLSRAAVPGMLARGVGTIVNVAGMIAFSGPATLEQVQLRRAVYAGTLANSVAFSQVLHEEVKAQGLRVQVLCPGVVATEFHERQGSRPQRRAAHVGRRRGHREPARTGTRRGGVRARRRARRPSAGGVRRGPRRVRCSVAGACDAIHLIPCWNGMRGVQSGMMEAIGSGGPVERAVSQRVVVIGSINVDEVVGVAELPAPGETVLGRERATGLGGKGANQAVAAAVAGDGDGRSRSSAPSERTSAVRRRLSSWRSTASTPRWSRHSTGPPAGARW